MMMHVNAALENVHRWTEWCWLTYYCI